MPLLKFNLTGITGLAAAVPSRVIDNYSYTKFVSPEETKKIVDKIGIRQRRFADSDTCASDLCVAAAERLFKEMGTDRSEVDALIFVSQTPDYRMPATSAILQDRLGLTTHTMTLDINHGCAGFVYGLSIAFSLLQQEHVRKALLLDGETRSRVYSPKDRKTAFLFGDAGVAAMVERNAGAGESWFSLNSDGSRSGLIKIDAGGYRNPSSPETLKEKVVDEDGNIRSDEHGYMNGADVFNFLLREVPKDIKTVLRFSGRELTDIDYYVFHQANEYMNSCLVKKLKLDNSRVPMSIEYFGNTSSASIPLTIVTGLRKQAGTHPQLLLSGFGTGLSWASAILRLHQCVIPVLIEI